MRRWLTLLGVMRVVTDFVLHQLPGTLNCFGKLPRDIRIKGERAKCCFPITSMVIVVPTRLFNLCRRQRS